MSWDKELRGSARQIERERKRDTAGRKVTRELHTCKPLFIPSWISFKHSPSLPLPTHKCTKRDKKSWNDGNEQRIEKSSR